MKRFCTMVLMGALFGGAAVAADTDAALQQQAMEASPTCAKFYGTVSGQAQEIIKDSKKSVEQKQENLAVLFNKSVDTNWIGKFVIGRYWKSASPEEQKEYLAVYNKYLTQIYVSKFEGDDLGAFELKLASMTKGRTGDIATKTLIKRPGQPDVHVDYTLAEVGGECRVHDITIENVSLLSSQRSEFQSLASQSGIAGVIEAIKKQLS